MYTIITSRCNGSRSQSWLITGGIRRLLNKKQTYKKQIKKVEGGGCALLKIILTFIVGGLDGFKVGIGVGDLVGFLVGVFVG